MLSTGLISFQWIVHHLFINSCMYLPGRDVPVRYHYPPFVRLGHGVCTMEALIFMHDRILNYRLQGITRS